MPPLSKFACAIALASIVGDTHALNINPDGLGQALLFPYYTVNGGRSTLISIANPTRFGKALKVRFLERYNGREVLDFNLYLAPNDIWTGALSAGSANDAPTLTTHDDSCTVPAFASSNGGARALPFSSAGYTNTALAEHDDAGPNTLSRAREGHFEVIEMGIVRNSDEDGRRNSLSAISRNEHGVRNCQQILDAWNPASADPYWRAPFALGEIDIVAPTAANGGGGLSGLAAMVNFTNGTQLTYAADAIEGFSVSVLHAAPGLRSKPQLSDANFPTASGATAYFSDDGVFRTASYPAERAIDAVSVLFTMARIHNEYVAVHDGTGAPVLSSEWILTFPTKRFYVDPELTEQPLPPFPNRYAAASTPNATGAPVGFMFYVFNREGNDGPSDCAETEYFNGCDAPIGPRFIPHEPGTLSETFVWAISESGQASPALNATLEQAFDHGQISGYGFIEGQIVLRLWVNDSPYRDGITDRNISRADLAGRRYLGLPVTGFWVTETRTSSVLANFAGIWRHRGRRCSVASGEALAEACPY